MNGAKLNASIVAPRAKAIKTREVCINSSKLREEHIEIFKVLLGFKEHFCRFVP